jgi:lipid-A-disaccharide synthase
LRNSRAALVTSGTATLETALWEVPQVVCYKGNWLSYQIARRLVQIPYISLVNLISGKPVVTELIQDQLSSSNLSRELSRLLFEEDTRTSMLKQYKELKILLGGAGASARTAESMVQYLRSKSV